MTKSKIIGAVAILAVGGAAAYYFLMPNKEEATKPKWITAAVSSGNIVQSITATGTIEPVTSVDVGTQVSGILTSLYVDYNSTVKKGQIIAELDKSTLSLDLANNKNTLQEAKAKLDFETANYKRVKAMYDNKLVADSEYETALYSYTTAQTAVKTAENNVKRSAINLGYATIYSPIDGVVLSRSVEEGQTVASSFSTPTLFTIAADLTDMRVIADVDEADIGNVKEGQRVSFTVDAFPGDTFMGAVTQVRQQATVESNVTTYEVVISAANPDLKLKPGLTASVEVFTLDVKCESVVPAAALSFNPGFEAPEAGAGEGKQPEGRPEGAPEGQGRPNRAAMKAAMKAGKVIWAMKDGRVIPCPVEVGTTNGILTEISGNNLPDSVVIGQENPAAVLRRPGGEGMGSSPFMPQRPGANRKK